MTEDIRRLSELIEEYNGTHGNSIAYCADEPMSAHTTFRIGGAADLFIQPADADALAAAASFVRECGTRYFVLGNGSNVLFDDGGFRGAVITTSSLKTCRIRGSMAVSDCGMPVTALAKRAASASLSGLEFAYGIPGTVGGAVFMNAGAFGGEISSVLVSSRYLDPGTLETGEIEGDGHEFGYRKSVYRTKKKGCIILSASFLLEKGNMEQIEGVMTDYMDRRVSKQPLEFPSAGSVFKRCEGRFTGKMIEEAGLKGLRIGGAEVSEKHAGFIINRGGATASDVLGLIDRIKSVILKEFGCELECEMIYVK